MVCGGLFNCVMCEVYVVEKVSFDFWLGEILLLVGEFGCGKLIIGWVLLRLVEIQGGIIIFDG